MLAEAFLRSGKVRDLSTLNDGRLLMVTSDRVSAFDVVLPTMIPDKGRVLTGLSRFWFAETAGIVPNHLLDTDLAVLTATYAADLRRAGKEPPDLAELEAIRGRIMICRPARVVPIEAVVRGYLAGSGWIEYQERGTVCGIPLPTGLRESEQLAEPVFTPATKAEQGEHDENISFDEMVEHIAAAAGPAHQNGRTPIPLTSRDDAGALAEAIRTRALRLYGYGAAVAARRGILLADTKFEFGLVGEPMPPPDPGPPDEWLGSSPAPQRAGEFFARGRIVEYLTLIDEVMTPDSSRFWDADAYEPGRPQGSFDKQFLREWLVAQGWDKTAPGPELPPEVVAGTRSRYIEAYERITGASFDRYLADDVIAP
jgi:phosphoribosylaminoimidazole-succinocarboxamide synthase